MEYINKTMKELIIKHNFDLETASSFFTCNPALVYKLYGKGKIQKKFDADIIFLNNEYEVEKVISKGNWNKKELYFYNPRYINFLRFLL